MALGVQGPAGATAGDQGKCMCCVLLAAILVSARRERVLWRIPCGLLTGNSELSFFCPGAVWEFSAGPIVTRGCSEIAVTHRKGTLVYLAWTFLTQLINPARWGGAVPYSVSLCLPVSQLIMISLAKRAALDVMIRNAR